MNRMKEGNVVLKTQRADRLMRHGLVAMLIALLGGFGLAFSMLGAIAISPLPALSVPALPGTPGGWRMLHTGMLMNGLMAIVLSLCLRTLSLSARRASQIYWGTLIAVWGNFVFYLMGMLAPNHGLGFEGNRLGEASLPGVLAYLGGLVAALALVSALFLLLRSSPSPARSD